MVAYGAFEDMLDKRMVRYVPSGKYDIFTPDFYKTINANALNLVGLIKFYFRRKRVFDGSIGMSPNTNYYY